MSDETNLPAVRTALELSVDDVKAQLRKVLELMQHAMKNGEDYGVIPGTQKPTLLKPGAEKILLMFRIDPQYETTETRGPGDHLTVQSRCFLYHLVSGNRLASGMGSCSTMESKYRWRKAERQCPACGAEAIIKGKAQYGGGWLCFAKKGGCGAKFADNDATITGQSTARVENADLADQWNTVLKMANKRSLIAAVLNATGASQLFTQDVADDDRVEDGGDEGAVGDGGRRKASGRGATMTSPPARPGPDELADVKVRAAFWRACTNAMPKVDAEAWIKERLVEFGLTDAKQLKVGQIAILYEKLEMHTQGYSGTVVEPEPAAEQQQQPDAPPAGMVEEEPDITW